MLKILGGNSCQFSLISRNTYPTIFFAPSTRAFSNEQWRHKLLQTLAAKWGDSAWELVLSAWNAYSPGTQELLIRAVKKKVLFCKERGVPAQDFVQVDEGLALMFMSHLARSVSAKVVEGTISNLSTIYGLLGWQWPRSKMHKLLLKIFHLHRFQLLQIHIFYSNALYL